MPEQPEQRVNETEPSRSWGSEFIGLVYDSAAEAGVDITETPETAARLAAASQPFEAFRTVVPDIGDRVRIYDRMIVKLRGRRHQEEAAVMMADPLASNDRYARMEAVRRTVTQEMDLVEAMKALDLSEYTKSQPKVIPFPRFRRK